MKADSILSLYGRGGGCASAWTKIYPCRMRGNMRGNKVLYQCSLTYRSGFMAGRGSHASGEAEWSVCGVGNLTRAA